MPPEDLELESQSLTPTPGEEFGAGGEGTETQAEPAAPAQPESAPAAQAPSAAETLSIVEAARKSGLNLGDDIYGQGDYATFQALVERARQAEQLQERMRQQDFYARLGQSIAPHAEKFQGYLQQQQAPPERNPWEPPTDRATIERYMQFVDQDPKTGLYASKPGIDPSVGKAVNDYQEYIHGFLANPGELISKAAETIAAKTFDQRFQERYQEMQRQQAVQSILQENAGWMYQYNPDGSPVRDASGRPALSPNGAAYARAVQQLDASGVKDPRAKNQLAIKIVQADLYAQQFAAQQTQQQAAPAQARALQGSGPNVNPLQSLSAVERQQTPGATEPDTTGLSFMEMTRLAMKNSGVRDEDFTPEAFSG